MYGRSILNLSLFLGHLLKVYYVINVAIFLYAIDLSNTVKNLFGYSDNQDSRKGRLTVDEAYVDTTYRQEEQTRIRIDRFTGGVMTGALFQDHPIRNTKRKTVNIPIAYDC